MSQGRIAEGANRHNRNHHHYGHKNKSSVEEKWKSGLGLVDPHSPVIEQFRAYSAELEVKYDRYERITKICRDITIESKRIIFLLHTLDGDNKRASVLGEAETRLKNLRDSLFKNIAVELNGQDPYQFVRAYQGGLQEFVEAVTFYQYLKNTKIEDHGEFEDSLIWTLTPPPKAENREEGEPRETKIVSTLVPPGQYILGIADLTGELMRKCINNLATGDIASCYQTCNFVRDMYKGFLGCGGMTVKELNRKVYTLKQSLIKMENICYTIKVRGSEIPKHMLADVANVANDHYSAENDEGYDAY